MQDDDLANNHLQATNLVLDFLIIEEGGANDGRALAAGRGPSLVRDADEKVARRNVKRKIAAPCAVHDQSYGSLACGRCGRSRCASRPIAV
jgi:hypothetical protein